MRSTQYSPPCAWFSGDAAGSAAEWQPTWLALGHTLRKLHRWDEASAALLTAHRLLPGQPATHAALGYTYQLQVRRLSGQPCRHPLCPSLFNQAPCRYSFVHGREMCGEGCSRINYVIYIYN